MKKILLIFSIIFSLFIMNTVKAENYTKFRVYATFDGVNQSEVGAVLVRYEIYGEEEIREAELTAENNYTYTSSDIPKGDIILAGGIVEGDTLGKYDVIEDMTQNGDDEIYIKVTVKNFEVTTWTPTKTTITESTTTTTKKATTTKKENSNSLFLVIAYGAIIGVILAVIIVFVMQARKTSKMY